MDLSALGNDIERVVASEEQIQTRLKELAEQVKKDYEGRDLILVGVLKGAVMAMADFHVTCNAMSIWIGWLSPPMVPEQSPVE